MDLAEQRGAGAPLIIVLALPWLVERFNPLGIVQQLPHARQRR